MCKASRYNNGMSTRPPTQKQLEALEAYRETGSIPKAAKKLQVTTQTLFARLSRHPEYPALRDELKAQRPKLSEEEKKARQSAAVRDWARRNPERVRKYRNAWRRKKYAEDAAFAQSQIA